MEKSEEKTWIRWKLRQLKNPSSGGFHANLDLRICGLESQLLSLSRKEVISLLKKRLKS